MSDRPENILNIDDAEEIAREIGDHWGSRYKILTPSMRPNGGRLGINHMRVRPGGTTCPFHYHLHEDEAFVILSGTGVLRYGETLSPIRQGDVISCPAGTKVAHQIVNNSDVDLVYLAIGTHDPNEVCYYPDNGKVLARGLGRVMKVEDADYFDGESDPPTVFGLLEDGGE